MRKQFFAITLLFLTLMITNAHLVEAKMTTPDPAKTSSISLEIDQ